MNWRKTMLKCGRSSNFFMRVKTRFSSMRAFAWFHSSCLLLNKAEGEVARGPGHSASFSVSLVFFFEPHLNCYEAGLLTLEPPLCLSGAADQAPLLSASVGPMRLEHDYTPAKQIAMVPLNSRDRGVTVNLPTWARLTLEVFLFGFVLNQLQLRVCPTIILAFR